MAQSKEQNNLTDTVLEEGQTLNLLDKYLKTTILYTLRAKEKTYK